MMPLLDPFYAVRHPAVARWLNRLLMLLELAIIALFPWYFYQICVRPMWNLVWIMPLLIVGVSVVNFFIRCLWNMVMVIIYGSTEPDQIEDVCDKMDGRAHAAEADICLPYPTYIDEQGVRRRIPETWE